MSSSGRKPSTPTLRVISYSAALLSTLILMMTVGCYRPLGDMARAPTASSLIRSKDAERVSIEQAVTPSRTPRADPTGTTTPTPTRTPRTGSTPTPVPTETATPGNAPTSTSSPSPTPTLAPAPTTTATVREYYLDSVGGDDANSGHLPDEAWQTLASLADQDLKPGDTVYFRKGSTWTTPLMIRDHGSPTGPLTFTTYGSGGKPIFENPRGRSGITIAGDWVIVEDMIVRNVLEAGVTIAADHAIVRNMEVTDAGMGVAVRGQHNLIRDNYLHDLKMVRNTPGGDDDYGAVGVWLFDSHNEVAYNLMVNCQAPSYDYGTDGGGVEIFGDNVDDSYIHHNWIIDSDGGLEIGGGSARNHVMAYNVFINNSWAIVIHLGGRYASEVENIRFEHNVVIETDPHDRPLFTFFRGEPSEDTLSVTNNIVYVLTGSVANHDAFLHQHNLYYLGQQARLGFRLSTGELVAHPRFVDLENHDFRLQAGSPAIDAGVDLGYEVDFTGRAVPQGAAPDFGAFEYSPQDLTEEAYKPNYPASQLP